MTPLTATLGLKSVRYEGGWSKFVGLIRDVVTGPVVLVVFTIWGSKAIGVNSLSFANRFVSVRCFRKSGAVKQTRLDASRMAVVQ